MRVLIDGDAFPNIDDIVELAQLYSVKVFIYCDYSHNMNLASDNVFINYLSPSNNGADVALINEVCNGDLVLTGDYGVAVMALSKAAFCLNQKGYFYTNDNIDYLLETKVINHKRRTHLKGPKKRTNMDRLRLLSNIEKVLRGERYEEEKQEK